MDGWMGGWMNGWMDAWVHGCMDGWMDACMHAWMDMDGAKLTMLHDVGRCCTQCCATNYVTNNMVGSFAKLFTIV